VVGVVWGGGGGESGGGFEFRSFYGEGEG